jgi:putative inorganic carbon (hco3(-)) transporter
MAPSGRVEWAGLLAKAEWPALILIAPLLLFPSPARAAFALALASVFWFASVRASGRIAPATPLDLTLVAFVVLTGASLATTFDVRGSLGKACGIVLGIIVYYATVRHVKDEQSLEWATRAFGLTGFGLAVFALLGTNWAGKFGGVGQMVMRLPGVIRGLPGAEEGFHPNAVAGGLVFFLPLQVAWYYRYGWDDWPARLGWGALAVVTGGTLLLTQSRGAFMGLAWATLASMCWSGRRSRRLALVVVAVVAAAVIWRGPGWFGGLMVSRGTAGISDTVSGRVELWSRAFYAIGDVPFTGFGLNNFRRVMPEWYPSFLIAPDIPFAHAHNQLLQAGVDLGVPGIVVFSAVWLIAGAMLWRVYRGAVKPAHRHLAGALAAGLIANFGFGLTDALPLGAKVGVVFWLTLGLAAALHRVWSARAHPLGRANDLI